MISSYPMRVTKIKATEKMGIQISNKRSVVFLSCTTSAVRFEIIVHWVLIGAGNIVLVDMAGS
jgi:hypothetical protein